ncbi:MAG: biopolymer transporter ExbD [Planctomycetes bacterium]|nr:biopolymer transporter ExbD [Planctomycetota bacterium]
MKVRNAGGNKDDKVEVPMTPMIDIVFQLLVFFIMTFKIVSQEGDFNIKMPLAAPSEGLPDPDKLPPMKVRLLAGPSRQLTQISLNDKVLGTSFTRLHNEIHDVIGDDRGPGSVQETAEVELDCDYNLRYEYVINAVTAVSGYLDENGNIVKLVEKIKFAPPRPPS